MEINKITDLIENFAPLELQEGWDNSGFQIDLGNRGVEKVLLCLSITQSIINQAIEKNCDMIISHHPLFTVPLEFNKNIPIYSAHTNLDRTDGGTTDTLIKTLGFSAMQNKIEQVGDFLRVVDLKNEISLEDFIQTIKEKLNLSNTRVANNFGIKKATKIAFCAGSGADFLGEAEKIGAQIFVTGDLKYHTALDSNVIIIDVGHFESEYPVLKMLQDLLENYGVEAVIADEKSPFINY